MVAPALARTGEHVQKLEQVRFTSKLISCQLKLLVVTRLHWWQLPWQGLPRSDRRAREEAGAGTCGLLDSKLLVVPQLQAMWQGHCAVA